MALRWASAFVVAAICSGQGVHPHVHHHEAKGHCPGDFEVPGHGTVSLIPAGWGNPTASTVEVHSEGSVIVTHMGGRSYFADTCNGTYSNEHYVALNLIGKTLRYTADLSGTGCGCNVAFYLVPMRSNPNPSSCLDYYCDANDVCGESCSEIDIMEANMYAFHSTLHTQFDHEGFGGGFGGGDGWNGPRDWNGTQYSPGGKCIDTRKPFDIAVDFREEQWSGLLESIEITLSQDGKNCPLHVRLSEYSGMADLSQALKHGMTPVVSYWSSDKMLWMDGMGEDMKGPCPVDLPDECPETAKVYNFSISEHVPSQTPPPKKHHSKAAAHQAKHHREGQKKQIHDECPGELNLDGHGPVSLVPSGWGSDGYPFIEIHDKRALEPHLGSRSYFANNCTAGKYQHKEYLALNLLGKKMSYTVDLSGAGCGCNVAFYLVSMHQNSQESSCNDYYCDANSVCGVPCSEIDIMEANERAWHTTFHTEYDHEGQCAGLGGGDGWNGPRDFMPWEYGPNGNCIDTQLPFQVEVIFPVDAQGILASMEVTLTQAGRSCPLSARLSKYRQMGMSELSLALAAGMTPVVSYWGSEKMLWLDGQGSDGHGPCWEDFPDQCKESVHLSDFKVEPLAQELQATHKPKGVCIDDWVLQPECVLEFEYKGKTFTGCTREDAKTVRWCSHDAKYKHKWSHCQPCEVMVAGNGERLVDKSLHVEEAQKTTTPAPARAQMWKQCGGVGWNGPTECVEPGVCQFMNEWWSDCTPPEISGACVKGWRPRPECSEQFFYDDTEFHGCSLTDNHGVGWCSKDAKFKGRWLNCTRCESPWQAGHEEVHVLQKFAHHREGTVMREDDSAERPAKALLEANRMIPVMAGLAMMGVLVIGQRVIQRVVSRPNYQGLASGSQADDVRLDCQGAAAAFADHEQPLTVVNGYKTDIRQMKMVSPEESAV